jgi:hypothetical protein
MRLEDYLCRRADFPFDNVPRYMDRIRAGTLASEGHMFVIPDSDDKGNFILPDFDQTWDPQYNLVA